MESHSPSPKSPRFTDTPPGSPKSCMKGSRKLTFEKPGDVVTGSGGNPVPIPSPKRSPKSVSIRMHDDDGGGGESSSRATSTFDLPSSSSFAAASTSTSEKKQVSKAPPPAEIQFQFELTQHYDQSTPPPNCTSNGNYEFDPEQESEQQEQGKTSSSDQYSADLRKDPQLVEIATKFVNDIIEKAKVEAADRTKAEAAKEKPTGTSERDSFSSGIPAGASNWVRRAHGLVSKWITNICVKAQNIKADLK